MDNWKLSKSAWVGALFFLLFLSCTEEYSEQGDTHRYFVKRYSEGFGEDISFIKECTDGRIFTSGNRQDSLYAWTYTAYFDAFGRHLYNGTMQAGLQAYTNGTVFRDGSFVTGNVFSSSPFMKYSPNGDELATYQPVLAPSGGYLRSKPIALDAKNIGFGICNGFAASSSKNYLIELDENLMETSVTNIPNTAINAKMLHLFYDRSEADYWYISGYLFTSPWNWSSTVRTFTAKVDKNNISNCEVHVLSTTDSTQDRYVIDRTITEDGSMTQLISDVHPVMNFNYLGEGSFELVHWDPDLNIKWRHQYDMGTKLLMPYSITRNSANGELIVVGTVRTGVNDTYYPFLLKTDKEGNVLLKKVYYEFFDGTFKYGYSTPDGTMFLGGKIELYGKKSEGSDALLLKTDAKGKY